MKTTPSLLFVAWKKLMVAYVLSLAGAVTYSAHLLVNEQAHSNMARKVFQQMARHRNALPIITIVLFVIRGLFLSGWVEAHVTHRIADSL